MKCASFFEIGKKKRKPDFFSGTGDVVKIFLFFLSTFFVSYQVYSQPTVTLGADLNICLGSKLKLSDLNPVITGVATSSWWSTSGDGTFSPTYTYPAAIYYTPGTADKANGFFIMTLIARESEPAGPTFSDQVTVLIKGDESFACNDNIIIPLNFYCEFKITPPMVLEGEIEYEPFNLYDLEIYDTNGDIIPNNFVMKDHIGMLLNYTVTHKCTFNACSGTILVKDNYNPLTKCKTDTITCKESTEPEYFGFPIDTSIFDLDTIFKSGINKYTVRGWDACSDVQLTYTDSLTNYDCSQNSLYQELIVRYWKAVDGSNNTSRCRDTIRVKRIGIDSIILPLSWNGVDTTALECDGDWLLTKLPNGYPSPEYTGEPEIWSCTQFDYTYEDKKFQGCGITFDIARNWTIIDWCTNEIVQYTQIIKIVDTKAPEIICVQDTITIGADPYDCSSIKFELPLPQIIDECSDVTLFVRVYNTLTNVEQPVQKVGAKFYIQNLPLKLYKVIITAIDKCNNQSKCTYYIKAIDDKSPYVVCDQHTKVSIGTNGIARLNAESVDDGSFDNCGIASFVIKKMTDNCGQPGFLNFGPFVDFCCVEANKTLMVVMKVTDISGLSNTCMVEVEVEDKLPPQIICPPDLTVSCDFYYDPDDMNRYFGKVVKDENLRENIIIYDQYNNGIVGIDGYTYDNCNVEVTSSVNNQLNNCNVGKLFRTFISTDDGGRTNQCVQTITIVNPEPFNYYGNDIIWPSDTTYYGCSNLQADTSLTGAPVVLDNMCSMVAVRYDDQIFNVQNGACEKIVRTWTIRDWCQSNEHVWTHEQFIMLFNTKAPVFTSSCSNREICVYGECQGLVELSAAATDDCTPPENLQWAWKLDLNKDGVFDLFGQGNNFSKTMAQGTYTISWIVEDKCGNKSFCTYDFKVKECKKPTPLCISDLTTVVMNQAGMVTVKAKSFDHGSYDNCTKSNYGPCGCLTDLKFSFSPNVNDTIFTVTCNDIPNGVAHTFTLEMWVTDEAGNQDYCTVLLQVQDNNGVCPDGLGMFVSGLVSKWSDDKPVADVNLKLGQLNGENSINTTTQPNGTYNFENLNVGLSYSLKPLDNPSTCLAGVSTADLVKIQKHILGVKKFDSPFHFIAADANNSQSVSAADMLEIRKLILGIKQTLPDNRCWTYVDSKHIPNIADPFNYSSQINYENLAGSKTGVNFKVVKIGDVTDSYMTVNGLTPRNIEAVDIYTKNTELFEGMEYDIPIFVNHHTGIEGLQFTIKFNPENMIFAGYESSQIDPVESNFGYQSVKNGYITFSWNTFTDKQFDRNTPAFYLKFKALNNAITYGNLMINGDITSSLAVVTEEEIPISFRFENNTCDELVVYQNNPNPFTDETTISFDLPEDDAVELKILDATGKLLFSHNDKYSKGLNHVKLNKSNLNARGVLYYSIKVKGNIVTKKMILID